MKYANSASAHVRSVRRLAGIDISLTLTVVLNKQA